MESRGLETPGVLETGDLKSSGLETRVELNVGGQVFVTTVATLRSLPHTRLGRLASEAQHSPDRRITLFFDRNPEVMNSLLDLYRTGQLHLPAHLCGAVLLCELAFWQIPSCLLHECCWRKVHEHRADATIVREIDRFLYDPYDVSQHGAQGPALSRWNKIWYSMEHPGGSLPAKVWSLLYYSVVVLYVLWFSLETVPRFRELTPEFLTLPFPANVTAGQAFASLDRLSQFVATRPQAWLRYPQFAMFAFFGLEFLLRLAACPSKTAFFRQARNCFEALVLLVSVVAMIIEYHVLRTRMDFTKAETDLLLFFYSLSMLRAFRVIYLAQHCHSMQILFLSARSSLQELLLLLVCVLTFVTMFGSLAYVTETVTRDHTFHSIPHGMWWAIVTMTTVGYGDVSPVGVYGQLMGALCTLSGVIVMALPVAVIASKFATYHDNLTSREQRRKRVDFLRKNPSFRRHHQHTAKHGDDFPHDEGNTDTKQESRQNDSDITTSPLFKENTAHPGGINGHRSSSQKNGPASGDKLSRSKRVTQTTATSSHNSATTTRYKPEPRASRSASQVTPCDDHDIRGSEGDLDTVVSDLDTEEGESVRGGGGGNAERIDLSKLRSRSNHVTRVYPA